MRWISQHIRRLAHRIREQARSHICSAQVLSAQVGQRQLGAVEYLVQHKA